MKKLYMMLSLVLVAVLLLSGCGVENAGSDTTAPADSTQDSTPQTEGQKKQATLGGIPISEISEVAYHGEELRQSAQKIAAKLAEFGAENVQIFDGTPTSGVYAVELGCADSDARMANVSESEAYIGVENGLIIAAVKGDTFDDKYAANILESFIGNDKYRDVLSKKIKLHDAQAVENDENVVYLNTFGSNAHFQGTTIGDSTGFNIGDKITFEIFFKQGIDFAGCDKFEYTVSCDDGKSISGSVDGRSGRLDIVTTVTTPGFVHVTVKAVNEAGISCSTVYEGGACAAIGDIEQSVAEPEDYDEFWAAQLKKLDDVGIELISKTEMESGNANFVAYDVQITCAGDRPATGVITMPKNAAVGSLDAQMRFQAYDGNVKATAPICVPGTICFAVNPHGVPSTGVDSNYYSAVTEEITKYEGNVKYTYGFYPEDNKDPNTCYFLGMFLRNIQAARYLLTVEEYNGEGITFYGASMGAFQATGVAAHIGAENVKSLEIYAPWMADVGCESVGKQGVTWGPIRVDENGQVLRGLLYFDTVNSAKRVSAKVKLESRLGDYICPPSGQVALFKAFNTQDKQMTFRQNSDHGYISPNDRTYTVKLS